MTTTTLERPLAVGDRFQLTDEAGPKLRPRGTRAGLIDGDAADCWRVTFDGTNAVASRRVHKSFITTEEEPTK